MGSWADSDTDREKQTYITAALADAHAKYSVKNPISAKAHKDAAQHMPGGNTRSVLYSQPFPMMVKSGAGNMLTSADGHTYTDFLGEYSAGLFGHSHPQIANAVTRALKGGWNYGAESIKEKELAQRVVERFTPAGMELVRFTNSGTEAGTMALATAIAWRNGGDHSGPRRKVLIFSNSYHGGTFVFPMAVCKWSHTKSSKPCPWTLANLPHDFVAAPYNNIDETQAIVDALPKDSLAAIIVEPVQGSGGCRPGTKEFLKFLRDTADRLGAVLIVDEVMSSRLGPSGSLARLGLKADLVTLGKWIGGGMSFGAFGGRREIMNILDPARGVEGMMHAGTFNNNAFTMSAGLTALDIFTPDRLTELNILGARMKTGITQILFDAGVYPSVHAAHLRDVYEIDSFDGPTRLHVGQQAMSRISGGEKHRNAKHLTVADACLPRMYCSSQGSLLSVRFTGPDAGQWHNLYYHFMLDKGIYLASRGFTPLSLELTDADVDMFVAAVGEFVMLHRDELIKID
jgi:glutamate-1-semialdehyde 2,1-aminomutase